MRHIFLALDDSGDYKIQGDEFADVCEAIGTKFIKLDEPPFLKVPCFFLAFPLEILARTSAKRRRLHSRWSK